MDISGSYTFNAPPDRPTRITIDDGAELFGGGARVEEFPVCNQYALQGDAFSRTVLGEAPLEFGVQPLRPPLGLADRELAELDAGARHDPPAEGAR